MGRFNIPFATTQDGMTPAEQTSPSSSFAPTEQPSPSASSLSLPEAYQAESISPGIDLHLRFRPTQEVWFLLDNRPRHERIIRIKTEHKSTIAMRYHPEHRITIVMESGTERLEQECFETPDEMAAWILSQSNNQ